MQIAEPHAQKAMVPPDQLTARPPASGWRRKVDDLDACTAAGHVR
jgi:hypothetical protein